MLLWKLSEERDAAIKRQKEYFWYITELREVFSRKERQVIEMASLSVLHE